MRKGCNHLHIQQDKCFGNFYFPFGKSVLYIKAILCKEHQPFCPLRLPEENVTKSTWTYLFIFKSSTRTLILCSLFQGNETSGYETCWKKLLWPYKCYGAAAAQVGAGFFSVLNVLQRKFSLQSLCRFFMIAGTICELIKCFIKFVVMLTSFVSYCFLIVIGEGQYLPKVLPQMRAWKYLWFF